MSTLSIEFLLRQFGVAALFPMGLAVFFAPLALISRVHGGDEGDRVQRLPRGSI